MLVCLVAECVVFATDVGLDVVVDARPPIIGEFCLALLQDTHRLRYTINVLDLESELAAAEIRQFTE
jgi:hypothetical protein